MEQDGHLKSLADRMREKAEQERMQTESVFSEQLLILRDSLLASSQNALRTMSDAMEGEITAATGELNRQCRTMSMAYGRAWMRTASIAFAMMLGLTTGGWALMKAAAHRLDAHRRDLAQVKAELREQRQTLETMQAGTWGLTLRTDKNGRFIILPIGTKVATGWTVGERKAIKLE